MEADSDSDGADSDSDGGRQRVCGWRTWITQGCRSLSGRPALLDFMMVSEYCMSVLVCLCLCVRGCDLSMRLECLSGSFSRSRTVKLIHDAITCLVNDPISESHFRVVISESRRASQTEPTRAYRPPFFPLPRLARPRPFHKTRRDG